MEEGRPKVGAGRDMGKRGQANKQLLEVQPPESRKSEEQVGSGLDDNGDHRCEPADATSLQAPYR
jgi:hypothetical protein